MIIFLLSKGRGPIKDGVKEMIRLEGVIFILVYKF